MCRFVFDVINEVKKHVQLHFDVIYFKKSKQFTSLKKKCVQDVAEHTLMSLRSFNGHLLVTIYLSEPFYLTHVEGVTLVGVGG